MSLEFRNICHAYEDAVVIDSINFAANTGEVTCLFGPSGCGKTTLLHIAAGLLSVQKGEIILDGELLADKYLNPPPEQRSIGLIFQESALFPHLSVAENIGFGITGNAVDRLSRVSMLLRRVGLPDFEGRYPHTLSGGQQQRVALARAIAPSPSVLLLDEPFANIDIQLRRSLREDTRKMLKDVGATAILVTHDPEEALELADQLVVLEAGHVLQTGIPEEIYNKPAAPGVAKLFGYGQSFQAYLSENSVKMPFGSWPRTCLANDNGLMGNVELVIRPESIVLENDPDGHMILDIRNVGTWTKVIITAADGKLLTCHSSRNCQFTIGQRVKITPKNSATFAYNSDY